MFEKDVKSRFDKIDFSFLSNLSAHLFLELNFSNELNTISLLVVQYSRVFNIDSHPKQRLLQQCSADGDQCSSHCTAQQRRH